MSNAKPIHTLHRDIRIEPDPGEPSLSFEQKSFLAIQLDREEDVADNYLRSFKKSTTTTTNNTIDSNTNNTNNTYTTYHTDNNKNNIKKNFERGNKNSNSTNNSRGSVVFGTNNSVIQNSPTETDSGYTKQTKQQVQSTQSLLSIELNKVASTNDGTVTETTNSTSKDYWHEQKQQKQQQQQQDFDKKKKVLTKHRSAERLYKMDMNNEYTQYRNYFGTTGGDNNTDIDDDDDDDDDDDEEEDLNNDHDDNNNNNARRHGQSGRETSTTTLSIPIPTMINIPDTSQLQQNAQYTPFLSGTGQIQSTIRHSSSTSSTNMVQQQHQQPMSFPGSGQQQHHHPTTGLDRSSSDQSTGSFLYCKTPNSAGLFGKSSSLIFPTGVDNGSNSAIVVAAAGGGGPGGPGPSGVTNPNIQQQSGITVPVGVVCGTSSTGSTRQQQQHHHQQRTNTTTMSSSSSSSAAAGGQSNSNHTNSLTKTMDGDDNVVVIAETEAKRASIAMAIDQCESSRGFPFSKKKLILSNLKMYSTDIPLSLICNTPLGNTLHKLDLSNNDQLGSIPTKLVQNLPALRILNLSQCSLNTLPDRWHLPKLTKLDLSNNRLDFPEESMLEGLPDLQELKMYGNIVRVITIPTNPKVLAKLETLDLGYNDLVFLPPDLDRLKSLRVLKVMNNFLGKVPARICEMELKTIDVSSNPITEPPIETCERGICSMRRYWHCIRLEEQTKTKAVRNQAKQLGSSTAASSGSLSSSGGGATLSTSATSAAAGPALTSQLIMNDNSFQSQQKLRRGFFNKLPKISPQQCTTSIGSARRANASLTSSSGSVVVVDNIGNAPIISSSTNTPVPNLQTGTTDRQIGAAAFSLNYNTNTPSVQPAISSRRQTSVTSNSSSSFGSNSSPQSKPKPKISIVEPVAESSPVAVTPMITAQTALTGPFTTTNDIDQEIMDGAMTKTRLRTQSSDEIQMPTTETSTAVLLQDSQLDDQVTSTVNDTLKVIFVGMAMVGKTTMIRRLIEGNDASVPTVDERTVGVDIYAWEPKVDQRFEHIDSRIQIQDHELAETCGDVDIKFSVWDFAGQHVYHATHELFFSNLALYVLVWDMGATNVDTLRRKVTSGMFTETGTFNLTYESSSDEDDDDANDVNLDLAIAIEKEARRADRALERDIDDKVQFWVDCIQSSAPGAAILPVASYSDYFDEGMGGQAEAIRRCNILKQRLLKHEERRRLGMEERLQEYRAQNPPNELAAARLQKLLCTYTRPKLIFGADDQNSVVRVSGKKYFGFELLTEKIINIATGRDKAEYTYPIFHGHVGARIPRMRLQVRDAVREMRDRFKVVEWGYFVNRLRDQGLLAVEDISDALHFLTNTGELSYFGPVMQSPPDNPVNNNRDGTIDEEHAVSCTAQLPVPEDAVNDDEHKGEQSEDDDNDDDVARLSLDDTSITAPSTADGSLTTVDDFMSTGLSHFVFLNPRWLVAAVACILRHDLDREIKETRRTVSIGGDRLLSRTASFFDAQLNCPVITADDAQLLWGANRITKKAAERAERFSNDLTMTPFEFLQRLLIRFGVFVPIDLTIEKATFGGKDYQLVAGTEIEVQDNLEPATPGEIMLYNASKTSNEQDSLKAEHFFLPSLLGPWDHTDAWTYKNTDSWKTTLCHSVLFPDGVPPGLMERLTASVLSSIYAVVNQQDTSTSDVSRTNLNSAATCEGRMSLKQVLCWRTAFYLKIGSQVPSGNGIQSESQVEIFVQLADRDAPLCVGSDYMEVGARRLIVSGRGQEGDGGRKIWKGGYLLVIKCVTRVMQAYGGLEYEMQGFCPECLAKVPVSQASSWELTKIRHAVLNLDRTLRCKHFGHPVDTRFLAGPLKRVPEMDGTTELAHNESSTVAVRDLQHAVVVVGLWDGREKKVTRVGSGFLCDRKRGLIVTAAHTLINIWGDPKYQYGENYYGLSQGKVVIGVIPEVEDNQGAVFRYFAKIVSRCNFLDGGSCRVDACVLRITTRMETDVAGDGSGCGDVPEILLLNNPRALKNERLQNLKMTSKCELNENVRILGYNQGGEGMVRPGEVLNRFIDLSRGYVSKKFVHDHNNNGKDDGIKKRDRFQPREEIVVSDCRTIGGHSGGPCVNQQGEVIGILSRADVADHQRCYLVPTSELEVLVRQAKKQM